jgi:hypothetical protein
MSIGCGQAQGKSMRGHCVSREGRARFGRIALALLLISMPTASRAASRGADGEYDERSSSHFVLFQDVDIDRTSGYYGSRRFELQILETLEEAYHSLDQQLGIRLRDRVTVTIHDPSVFDTRFAGLFRFPAAGFYGGTIHIRGDTAVTRSLVAVLHHELVHAAFDAELPSRVLPAWFNEGVAEWFEARSVGQRRLSARQQSALSQMAQGEQLFTLQQLSSPSFAGLGPGSASLAYLQSYGFFEFLERRDGERRLRDLCRSLIRTADLELAFRRTYRGDLASLESEYVSDLLGR